MNDTQHLLGKLLQPGEGVRDAIHIAVLPVTMAKDQHNHSMMPGEPVKLVYGTKDQVVPLREGKGIGIVDPFLIECVKGGDRFFVFLYPNTVSGMVHHWSHPEIDKEEMVSGNEHEVWLRRFADRWRMNYDEMISAPFSDRYVVASGIDLHSSQELGDEHDLFWHHMEALLGSKFDKDFRDNFAWSCSC